jgi:2-deoxy-D-gluconate 3-dehydrogenase
MEGAVALDRNLERTRMSAALQGIGSLFSDLKGRTAFVTGAFGGLGRHFALTLASAGCRVALAGRRTQEGEGVLAEVRAAGSDGCVVKLDVRNPASVAAAFDEASTALGTPQVVVNNAGVAGTKPAFEQTEEDWQFVVDTNLNGVWRVAQAAARRMQAHGQGGSIVNIASVAGLRVMQQVPSYNASKAGVIHLTRALALEWARHGIRVNAIAPGYIGTDINHEHFASEAGQAMIKRVPQRRIGEPEHLDGALLLLASDASTYMTGSVVVVDGGHAVSSL